VQNNFDISRKRIGREGCGRKDIWHKHALGCMAGLTLALVFVAAGLTVRGVSESGQAVNRAPH